MGIKDNRKMKNKETNEFGVFAYTAISKIKLSPNPSQTNIKPHIQKILLTQLYYP